MTLGKSLPHDSAHLHVSGSARYTDDIPLPGPVLHLCFGLAGIAHGRVTALDLSPVRSAPGVVHVIGPDDLSPMPDCAPVAHDEPLLSRRVMFHGQPVFLVIADSHLAARKAARLAVIGYDEATPILTIDAALAANSRFEQGPITWARGDATRAIADAPRVIEGRIEIGGQEHFYLEGQVAAAVPGEDGMTVYSSTQHPTEIQHKIAHALHLPMSAVRVEVRRMGGGFGGKESQGNALAIACALAARLTGRACKMRYDRDDDFVITGKRHDARIEYRVGVDDTGAILGLTFRQLVRCGWSQDLSLAVADRAMLHADNCYHIPHMAVESHRLKTHTASATAFRGFGGPQGMLGVERVMDHIAHVLKVDPLTIRQRNFYAPATAKAGQTTHYGMPVEDFVGGEIVARLAETSDYADRRARIAAWNAASPIFKKGIALTPVKFGISFTLTWLNQAGALVHVYQDGSVHLNHGGTEMGQGLNQKVAQVVAGVFGLEAGAIRITATDTGKVPNTSATAASSGSDLNGKAAEAAARTIRDRLAAFVAEKHQVKPAAVRFQDGTLRVAGEVYDFARVAMWAYQARIGLSATGFYATPKIVWDRIRGTGRPFYYFAYGAAVTEVVIDTLTGENRILRTDILHDTGTSLNPAIDVGQIEGGFVQGAGWLTTEELVWDGKGRLLTHAPATYKIPAVSDRPAVFNVALWDQPNREDAVGKSKAVGEPPLMLANSVLLALSDAVAACGDGRVYPALDAPATPERVLWAIERVRHG